MWEKMGSSEMRKVWSALVFVLCFSFFCGLKAVEIVEGTVFIDGNSAIAKTDEDFICATLDWWPPEKCDYGTCSWGRASLLNLDLKNIVFLNAIKAFSHLKIRLGGSLQDKIIYQTEDDPKPCIPFARNSSEMFGFTKGCLPLARWEELNSFFNQSGAHIIFGLNALYGKSIQSNNTATGPWDPANAASLIRHTFSKGYNIYGWELGNELCGWNAVGVGVPVDQYISDTIVLHDLIQDIYKGVSQKPLIIAPGGFFDSDWFQRFIAKTVGSLDVVTHHIYNLGPGSDEHLINKVTDPAVLDGGAGVFENLQSVIKSSGTSVSAWVGESGGAYNSGRNGVSNRFVYSFWYLDQLGASSTYGTKTYCRQTLIGGNYGLLNTTTFAPNPDYYSALLWHRLMGQNVLSTNFTGTRMLRSYAHCAKHTQGITVLLMNLDANTTVQAKLNTLLQPHRHRHRHHRLREREREEYHLTPLEGNIQSQTVLLNGKALEINSSGAIPALEPVRVALSEPITVAPHSIVFVHLPTVVIPACRAV